LLLSARADPTACDDHGCSSLHRAAESGASLEVVQALLTAHDYAARAIDSAGCTPLVYPQSPEVERLLI
jgi:hypothetical protein